MPLTLTKKQKEMLDWVAAFIAEKGYGPSHAEIASGRGLASLASVHKHLVLLKFKGYIAWDFNCARSLRLVTACSCDDTIRLEFLFRRWLILYEGRTLSSRAEVDAAFKKSEAIRA